MAQNDTGVVRHTARLCEARLVLMHREPEPVILNLLFNKDPAFHSFL